MFQAADGRNIAFREQILPYWTQVCDEVYDQDTPNTDSLLKLKSRLTERAQAEFVPGDRGAGEDRSSAIDSLHGGLWTPACQADPRVELKQALHVFNMRFRQMEERKAR